MMVAILTDATGTLTVTVNNINDGGLYVVEDVHSSYQKHYGNPYKYSFINFTKKIVDDINCNFPGIKNFKYSLNKIIYSTQYFESIVSVCPWSKAYWLGKRIDITELNRII